MTFVSWVTWHFKVNAHAHTRARKQTDTHLCWSSVLLARLPTGTVSTRRGCLWCTCHHNRGESIYIFTDIASCYFMSILVDLLLNLICKIPVVNYESEYAQGCWRATFLWIKYYFIYNFIYWHTLISTNTDLYMLDNTSVINIQLLRLYEHTFKMIYNLFFPVLFGTCMTGRIYDMFSNLG